MAGKKKGQVSQCTIISVVQQLSFGQDPLALMVPFLEFIQDMGIVETKELADYSVADLSVFMDREKAETISRILKDDFYVVLKPSVEVSAEMIQDEQNEVFQKQPQAPKIEVEIRHEAASEESATPVQEGKKTSAGGAPPKGFSDKTARKNIPTVPESLVGGLI